MLFGFFPREKIEQILLQQGVGTCIIRLSESQPGQFVVSFVAVLSFPFLSFRFLFFFFVIKLISVLYFLIILFEKKIFWTFSVFFIWKKKLFYLIVLKVSFVSYFVFFFFSFFLPFFFDGF